MELATRGQEEKTHKSDNYIKGESEVKFSYRLRQVWHPVLVRFQECCSLGLLGPGLLVLFSSLSFCFPVKLAGSSAFDTLRLMVTEVRQAV